MKNILITGGAGFIGSYVCDELISKGYEVTVLDNLTEQVHGPTGQVPAYLNPKAEFVRGNILDGKLVDTLVQRADGIVHLAARVGVGQSMYDIREYVEGNSCGTATLLEAMVRYPGRKLVVASSMSIYGEGEYKNVHGQYIGVQARPMEQLANKKWELMDGEGEVLQPIPTEEEKCPRLSSVYAITKYDQEQLCMNVGQAYNIPVTALRLFNVYGPRQALSNPYTGVMAIFSSRLLNGKPPLIYEDGLQQRDFVHVKDVAKAFVLALESKATGQEVYNIGSGNHYTILSLAKLLGKLIGREDLTPEVTGQYRVGDIRHCFANIAKAEKMLGYHPEIDLESGMGELARWLDGQHSGDRSELANRELLNRGLRI